LNDLLQQYAREALADRSQERASIRSAVVLSGDAIDKIRIGDQLEDRRNSRACRAANPSRTADEVIE
jgi:hypothetical protein